MSNMMIGASLTEILGQTQIVASHSGSEFNDTFRQAVNPMFAAIAGNNASLENKGPTITPDLQNNNTQTFKPGLA